MLSVCVGLNANGQADTANHTQGITPHLPTYRELVELRRADKAGFELKVAAYGFVFLQTTQDTGWGRTVTSSVYQYPQKEYSYARNAVRLARTLDTAHY